jgi:hypothetical protein
MEERPDLNGIERLIQPFVPADGANPTSFPDDLVIPTQPMSILAQDLWRVPGSLHR